MTGRVSVWILSLAAAGGCGNPQPFVTPERLDRGLVLVLTGIEGRSPKNRDIRLGLNDGGVNAAIEVVDWTAGVPGAYLMNLWARERNRTKAEEIVDRIVRYQMACPGRPVVLVGHSGGAGIAAWVSEFMPPGRQVDGIIFLAAALSRDYPLEMALMNSRRGIVNFHSLRDWVFLGAGTLVTRTMDGKHGQAAGRVGFDTPAATTRPKNYAKLFQIKWSRTMAKTGHYGGHLSSSARGFVGRYVAPLVRAQRWDAQTVEAVLAGDLSGAPADDPGGR